MKKIFNNINFNGCISSHQDEIIYIKEGDNQNEPCRLSDFNNFDFKINNLNEKEIFFLKIDNCLFYSVDGRKCDFSVNDDSKVHFVEIKYLTDFSNSKKSKQKKRKKKNDALDQIIKTISRLKTTYTFDMSKVYGVICLKPNIPQFMQIIQTDEQVRINRFLIETGCPNLYFGNEITY